VRDEKLVCQLRYFDVCGTLERSAGRVVFKRFGWGVAALITPITLLTTGIAFFSLTLFPAFFAPITAK
jgi:ATP/ADP translocase